MKSVKGIMIDYGGTIDASGDHWSEVIYDGYESVGLNIAKPAFRKCYVEAERALASERLIFPRHNFLDLMEIKISLEFDFLKRQGYDLPNKDIARIARFCYDCAHDAVEEAKPVLDWLYLKYPMALISNFYGNIESVLLDFGLRHFFTSVIESSVVGVRKPDPRIFKIGALALNLPPENVVVIGDSYKKDIKPALSIGCSALWVKGRPWNDADECNEDGVAEISNLAQLRTML